MRQIRNNRLPSDLEQIAGRLREERPEASSLELDRIKTRAMRQATESTRIGGPVMRSRIASIAVVIGVLLGGTGVVMAATGGVPGSGGSSGSAPNNQYCPPSSNNPGAPKHPQNGQSCGKQH